MVRDDEDGEMSPEEIMKMDWLADIVVGSIPTLDELVEDARDVVAFQGVFAIVVYCGIAGANNHNGLTIRMPFMFLLEFTYSKRDLLSMTTFLALNEA